MALVQAKNSELLLRLADAIEAGRSEEIDAIERQASALQAAAAILASKCGGLDEARRMLDAAEALAVGPHGG